MTALTNQDASRRSGLSEPTLRYYEEVGLIGPVARDPSSRHRRYREEDLDTLQALACLRAMGVGIEDMRTYQANRVRGREAAGEQRDLLCVTPNGSRPRSRRYGRIWTTCERRRRLGRPGPLRVDAETDANLRVQDMFPAWKRWCCDEPGARHRRVRLWRHAADRRAAAGGPPVRATVRSLECEHDVRAAMRRGGADDSRPGGRRRRLDRRRGLGCGGGGL